MSDFVPADGRDIPEIGHGNFRPAIAPAGTEGLRQSERHMHSFQAEGARLEPWAGEAPSGCSHATKAGAACKMPPVKGTDACVAHSPRG